MKTQNPSALAFIVSDTYIRQDEQARYSLNDLHRAAGGEEKQSPNRWTRTESYQALVNELRNEQQQSRTPEMASGTPDVAFGTPEVAFDPVVTTRGGARSGTFVCIELVYAYAEWINPAFHLSVIRTHHALLTSKQPARQDLALVRQERLTRLAVQLVTAIERAKTSFGREELLDQLRAVKAGLGMAPPNVSRLPAFPDPDAQEKATIKAFWKAVDELQSQGAQLNHARDSTLIAVCLKHFLAEAKKRKVQVPSRVALLKALPHSKSPAYQSTKAVNSAIQSGSVYCWVFRAPEEAPAGDQPPLFEEPT